MSKDHLKRRGFQVSEDGVKAFIQEYVGWQIRPDLQASEALLEKKLKDTTVTGRRARKDWPCAGGSCELPPIEWDEVYVEVAIGIAQYNGKCKRLHLSCALAQGIIQKVNRDATNQRRHAIAMVKAKRKVG